MGCDIHLHVEVKINGKWEHWTNPSVDRNYDLFAKMAGVRNNGSITPISEPKGLPKDLSVVTQFAYEYEKDDAHTESWLNRDEIKELAQWYENTYPRGISLECSILHSYCVGYSFKDKMYHEDARFVFWFDN